MSDYTGLNVNNSNGYFEELLKNRFGYKVTVYDEFEREQVLKMLSFIDDLAMKTSEINSSDSDVLNNLSNIIQSHNVTKKHLEQLLKVLEFQNVLSSDIWHSKNYDEEQKLRNIIKDI